MQHFSNGYEGSQSVNSANSLKKPSFKRTETHIRITWILTLGALRVLNNLVYVAHISCKFGNQTVHPLLCSMFYTHDSCVLVASLLCSYVWGEVWNYWSSQGCEKCKPFNKRSAGYSIRLTKSEELDHRLEEYGQARSPAILVFRVFNTVHRETHEILPEGVLLEIHHHGIHLLDCFHGNAWGLGSHVLQGGHHALLCASA